MIPTRAGTVLFDIDGTLCDTNYLHVLAWRRAFLDAGLDVAAADIHRRIGMGSGQLMADLVGEAHDDVKRGWRHHFDELKPEIRAFPRASELLVTLAGRGTTVVLASSSEQDDVEALVEAIDAGDAVAQVISAGDVDEAKPSPEVFQVAMRAVDADPLTTLAVGDTVWDVVSSRAAGVGCIAVCSGGIAAAELAEAGAVAVYRDVADLLDHLDDRALGGRADRGGRSS